MHTITLIINVKEEKARNKAKSSNFRWNAENKVWTRGFASLEEMEKWEKWALSNTNLMCYKSAVVAPLTGSVSAFPLTGEILDFHLFCLGED